MILKEISYDDGLREICRDQLNAMSAVDRKHELKAPIGAALECTSGLIWITLDKDPRDVLLDPGQTFLVDRDQRTLVMALEDASVRVSCTELA